MAATGTSLTCTSGTSYLVYVGRAPKAATAVGVHLRTVTAAGAVVSKAVVGVLKGTPPTGSNGTATLTSLGSANFTNSNNTPQVVSVSATIAAGDDLWLAIYVNNSGAAATIQGMTTDPLLTGVYQTYSGDFTSMSGTSTTACGTSSAVPPALIAHIAW
jgi:hypothetical protein